MKRLTILIVVLFLSAFAAACAQPPETGVGGETTGETPEAMETSPLVTEEETTEATATLPLAETPTDEEEAATEEPTATEEVAATPTEEMEEATATAETDETTTPETAETDETATPETAATDETAEVAEAEGTIADLTNIDGRFLTLVNALLATDLVTTLDEAAPYTLFAPTDEAFAALPPETLDQLLQNPELLSEILLYHVVVNEALMADELETIDNLQTAQGEFISVQVADGTVTLNDEAQVITANITVPGGVVHAIDTVLVPPDVDLSQ